MHSMEWNLEGLKFPIIVQNQVNVEMVLHNLELLGVDPDQSWVVDAENTGRVASIFSLLTYNIQ